MSRDRERRGAFPRPREPDEAGLVERGEVDEDPIAGIRRPRSRVLASGVPWDVHVETTLAFADALEPFGEGDQLGASACLERVVHPRSKNAERACIEAMRQDENGERRSH